MSLLKVAFFGEKDFLIVNFHYPYYYTFSKELTAIWPNVLQ